MAGEVYDLGIIGGGPGGYVAAIRAAQLGLKVVIVEKNPAFGGTCLNVGCIPSKALLDSSEFFARVIHESERAGLGKLSPKLDLGAMMKRKAEVVSKLTGGVGTLLKGRKITIVNGLGRLPDSKSLKNPDGSLTIEVLEAPTDETWSEFSAEKLGKKEKLFVKTIILAAGSVPSRIPSLPWDGKFILDSTDALSLKQVPQKLGVIGAGAIGLELGSVWSRLGSEVTVIEALPQILNNWDAQVQSTMKRELEKQGLRFMLGAKVEGATVDLKAKLEAVKLTVKPAEGEVQTLAFDAVLVAVGRRAYLESLNLDAAGVQKSNGGRFIQVDDHFKTSVAGIYAIGDCIGGLMLAHKAEEEGVAAAEIIAGKPGHVNYQAIPGVVYTEPEAAMVGKTEETLKAEGIPYKSGSFKFLVNGRALAMDATAGFVKILAHEKTDRILGAHLVGKGTGELVAEIVAAMELGGSAEDLGRISHAHPSLSEVTKEAALAVGKRAIHSL